MNGINCFIDQRICYNQDCNSCLASIEYKEKLKKLQRIEDGSLKVKLITYNKDIRCEGIFNNALDYLSSINYIDISSNINSYDVIIHYRFLKSKKVNKFPIEGVLVDDLPHVYIKDKVACERFIENLKTYDFYIVPNIRLGVYLNNLVSKSKPIVYYPGISGKEYYKAHGYLSPIKKNQNVKRMALLNSSYEFNIKDFVHNGWEMLYFSRTDKNIPNSICVRPTDILNYYKIVSSFSPDIVIQDWIEHPNFYYKSNLKMRDAVVFNSCLLARDEGNIYGINQGVNCYTWNSLTEFHRLLDTTPIETFRKIGISLVDTDVNIIKKFHKDLEEVFVKLYKGK